MKLNYIYDELKYKVKWTDFECLIHKKLDEVVSFCSVHLSGIETEDWTKFQVEHHSASGFPCMYSVSAMVT